MAHADEELTRAGLPLLHPDDTHDERTGKLTQHYQHLSERLDRDSAYEDGEHPLYGHHQDHGVPSFNHATHSEVAPHVRANIASYLSRHIAKTKPSWPPSVDIEHARESAPDGVQPSEHAIYHPYGNHIVVNHAVAHDPDEGGDKAEGWYSRSGDASPLGHVLAHEYGHFLKHQLKDGRGDQMLHEVSGHIPGATRYDGGNAEHWLAQNHEPVSRHVGGYAASHPEELVAELYAEHHHSPDPSEAAQTVGRHLGGRTASAVTARKLVPEPGAMLRTAARDRDFGFHITASWADVQRKAKRIRSEGGVTIVIASNDGVGGHVKGDHGTYEALLVYRPGTKKVADWTCGCKWAAYAFERSPGFQRFEGRKCSHALALQFEAQSQGMFGKEVHPSEPTSRERPIVRYDPDAGEHVFARPYEGSLIGSLVARLRADDADPAEVVGNLIRAGVKHRTAVLLWKAAEHEEGGERRCPHCGGFIGVEAVEHHRCPHCGTPLGGEGHEHHHEAAKEHGPLYRGIFLGYGDDKDMEHLHSDPESRYRTRAAGHGHTGTGVHWTPNFEVAKDFALNRNAGHEPMLFGDHDEHQHGVILESHVHPDHQVDRMSEEGNRLSREHGGIYFPDHREQEVTVRPGSPIQVTHVHALSMRDDGTDERHSRVPSGSHYTAAKDTRPPGPHVSGIALKAHDTGRVLMLQRGLDDENDPAAGTWEFPGGHHEDGDATSLHAGIREWQEEIGQEFPTNGVVKHVWTSPNGVYQGHVVVIPSEKDLSMKYGRVVPNPDDPKGDSHEQAAWWDPEHARKIPNLRPEVKKDTPWKEIGKASLDTAKAASAWDPISNTNPQPGRGTSEPAHSNTTNPASTGWAAGEDPDNWNNLDANPEPLTPSLGFDAALHDEPEPALPVAYGDEDATMRPAEMTQADLDPVPDNPPPAADLVPDQDANIHLLDGGSSLPNSYHASIEGDRVAAIVAAFQKSAIGQQLVAEASGGGGSDEDIAAAARAHLEKTAARQFNFAEQQELISEGAADGRQARNLGSLQIKGTHYELLDAALRGDGTDPTDLFL
jgi:8-oxo-dGTP pyrophosphatase MutT (NUDIX family)